MFLTIRAGSGGTFTNGASSQLPRLNKPPGTALSGAKRGGLGRTALAGASRGTGGAAAAPGQQPPLPPSLPPSRMVPAWLDRQHRPVLSRTPSGFYLRDTKFKPGCQRTSPFWMFPETGIFFSSVRGRSAEAVTRPEEGRGPSLRAASPEGFRNPQLGVALRSHALGGKNPFALLKLRIPPHSGKAAGPVETPGFGTAVAKSLPREGTA